MTSQNIYMVDDILIWTAKIALMLALCFLTPLCLFLATLPKMETENPIVMRQHDPEMLVLDGTEVRFEEVTSTPKLPSADHRLFRIGLAKEDGELAYLIALLPTTVGHMVDYLENRLLENPGDGIIDTHKPTYQALGEAIRARYAQHRLVDSTEAPFASVGLDIGNAKDIFDALHSRLMFFLVVAVFDLVVFIAAAMLWATGQLVRRREDRIIAIWTMLTRAVETSLMSLVYNTGYSKREVLSSIRKINRLASSDYVIDPDTSVVYDERLAAEHVQVRKCPSCGFRSRKAYALLLQRAPACDSCGNPYGMTLWNKLKLKRLREIVASSPAADPSKFLRTQSKPFVRSTFLFLLLFFWPAALFYAFNRSP